MTTIRSSKILATSLLWLLAVIGWMEEDATQSSPSRQLRRKKKAVGTQNQQQVSSLSIGGATGTSGGGTSGTGSGQSFGMGSTEGGAETDTLLVAGFSAASVGSNASGALNATTNGTNALVLGLGGGVATAEGEAFLGLLTTTNENDELLTP